MSSSEWVPLAESKPAPMPLLLLQSFVNTLDSDNGTDELATPETARAWLAAAGLIGDRATVSEADAEHARAVREALRALIADDAQRGDEWSRLKACADPTCRWIFYDASRNRQGAWCSMATCGNRAKNRDLRARRRE